MNRLTAIHLLFALGLAACSSDPQNDDSTSTSGDEPTTGPTGPDPDSSSSSADTTTPENCGNGAIDDGEECDGEDLGGAACADVDPSFIGGTLSCGATCTFDASACEISPDAALVTLNEVTSESVISGEFAGPNDAIELHNAGGAAADLSGWSISDEVTFPPEKTYVIPNGTMLEPGAFLVLRSLDELTGEGDFPFGISDNNEETLSLANAEGVITDAVTVDGFLARVSYCRVPDSTGPWFQCEQTFGAANQMAATACGNGVIEGTEACDGDELDGNTCESLGLGYVGGRLGCRGTCKFDIDLCTLDGMTVLNEINASSEDIEIFNGSEVDIDLSGFVLTDDEVDIAYDPAVDTDELIFPDGTILAAGEYLVVSEGLGPGQHPFGVGLAGDTITLADPAGPTILDQVEYEDGEATISYCRQPNGPGGAWMAGCAPTMGGAN